jgi:hypothetical protein
VSAIRSTSDDSGASVSHWWTTSNLSLVAFARVIEVHPWTTGYHRFLDHPHHAVTHLDGRFEIKNAPCDGLADDLPASRCNP